MEQDPELLEVLGRLPGETRKAHQALVDYAMMPRRSLATLTATYQEQEDPPTRWKTTLERWSSRFEWQRRVVVFDQAREEARIEAWARRSEEINEQDWQHGQELREKAMRCLQRLDEEGVSLGQIVHALLVASKIQRLATEQPTDRVQLTGAALDAAIEKELARLCEANQTLVSTTPFASSNVSTER